MWVPPFLEFYGTPYSSYESSSFFGKKSPYLIYLSPKAPYTPSNTSWTGTSPLQRRYLRSPLRWSPPWPLGERWSGNLQDLKLGEYVGILCKHIYIYESLKITRNYKLLKLRFGVEHGPSLHFWGVKHVKTVVSHGFLVKMFPYDYFMKIWW